MRQLEPEYPGSLRFITSAEPFRHHYSRDPINSFFALLHGLHDEDYPHIAPGQC